MILDDLVNAFKENALPVLISQNEREWRAFLFRYIYFVIDNHRKLVLSKNSNVPLFFYKLSQAVHDLSQSFHFPELSEKYSVSARISAINSVLLRWIDDGRVETPEEIVDYLMSFILTI